MGQTNRRPSVWCSKYYFFSWFLAKFFAKILSIYFLIKIKSFECPKSTKSIKKIILGTSDSWSTIRLSHRPSDPVYYIVNWRISSYEFLNSDIRIHKIFTKLVVFDFQTNTIQTDQTMWKHLMWKCDWCFWPNCV